MLQKASTESIDTINCSHLAKQSTDFAVGWKILLEDSSSIYLQVLNWVKTTKIAWRLGSKPMNADEVKRWIKFIFETNWSLNFPQSAAFQDRLGFFGGLNTRISKSF